MKTPRFSDTARSLLEWNQKLHTYLGLYFIVLLWLFAASGLVLNHSWRFTEFWDQRQQSTTGRAIAQPQADTDLGRARDLMRQLDIDGEIEWTTTRPTPDRFDFRVTRPGRITDVKADFAKQTATIQEIRVNGWGTLRMLHTFTGVRPGPTGGSRDWWLTRLWSFAMDALAVGLILLVATSFVMACERSDRWMLVGVALGFGLVACGFFVFGLRWL